MSETAPSAAAARTEAESLLSFLERNRRTFAWKTSGLHEKGLRATTAASAMTLGGLVKHVALVEADWAGCKGRWSGVRIPLGRGGLRR
ncbi:mycothiol transferase [Actinopolymorpha pittospori]